MGERLTSITTLGRFFSNFRRVGSGAHKRTGCATGASHYRCRRQRCCWRPRLPPTTRVDAFLVPAKSCRSWIIHTNAEVAALVVQRKPWCPEIVCGGYHDQGKSCRTRHLRDARPRQSHCLLHRGERIGAARQEREQRLPGEQDRTSHHRPRTRWRGELEATFIRSLAPCPLRRHGQEADRGRRELRYEKRCCPRYRQNAGFR